MSGSAWEPLAAEAFLALAGAALKGLVLLCLATGLALTLRRAPARVRHLLWGSALVALLLLPGVGPLLPSLEVGLLPAPRVDTGVAAKSASGGGVAEALSSPDDRQSAAPARGLWSPTAAGPAPADSELSRLPLPSLWDSRGPSAATTVDGPLPVYQAGRQAVSAGAPAVEPAAPPATFPTPVGFLALLAGLWIVGFALALAAQAAGLWRLARLVAGTRPLAADSAWRRSAERLGRRLGLSRPVDLRAGTAVRTPMTFGLWRPVVLLPATAARWSTERRDLVLLHELTHVRRGDWPVLLLARLAVAFHWFNPLAWRALARLLAEQEAACDEAVLATGARPSRYAAHLLAIARALANPSPRPLPALDMARSSQMEDRLMSILDFPRKDRSRNVRVLPVVGLVLVMAAALAAVQPFAEAAAPAAPASSGEGLTAVLGELAALEARLQPYEARLAEVERELEPYEQKLQAVEAEMEPVEAEIDRFEDGLEPYETRLAAVEEQLEPYELRLEEMEGGLEPYEMRLAAVEEQLEPYEAQLEQLEEQLAPVEERMEALEEEMEPVHQRMEEVQEQIEALQEAGELDAGAMEQLQGQLSQLQGELEPLHSRMRQLHEQMRPVHEQLSAVHEQMRPVHEQLSAIHEEMRPQYEALSQVHEQMRPVHEQLSAIHEEMRPHFEQMEQVHARLEPFHANMQAVHEEMEPLHQRMEAIHREMEPIHQELEQLHERLDQELRSELRSRLEAELGGRGIPAAALDRAAERIADSASIRVSDGRLRLLTSAPEVREILLAEVGDADGPAVDRAVAAIAAFEVEAPGSQRSPK